MQQIDEQSEHNNLSADQSNLHYKDTLHS